MVKTILLLCIFCLLGCSIPYYDNYTVYIDKSFRSDEQQSIVAATDLWLQAIPTLRLNVIIGECNMGEAVICIHRATLASIQNMQGNNQQYGGITIHPGWTLFDDDFGSSNIYLPVDILDEDNLLAYPGAFMQASAHELGHGLGLIHTQYGTLMYRQLVADVQGGAQIPTCTDLQQYYKLRHKDLDCPIKTIYSE
jgi:hypothetical protein